MLILIGVVCGWGQARADLTLARTGDEIVQVGPRGSLAESELDVLLGLPADLLPEQTAATQSPAAQTQSVQVLPPPPDSASLFVSALLSIGAWQALRNARHVSLGTLPEWYHEGAPAQLGHSRAADPFHLAWPAMAAPWTPPPRPCSPATHMGWDISRPHALCFPPIPDRRGPPRVHAA